MVMGNQNFFDQDFFQDILAEDPRSTFFSFQDQFGQSPNQRRFFQSQFQPIQDEFTGFLANQLRQGQLPQQSFSDFLGDFPFTQRFSSLPPDFRGARTSRFAPRTQFGFG